MKSNNKMLKFTTFVMLLTILTCSLVSGTFAKYTSAVSGSDSAIVAKWDVQVNGNKITNESSTLAFNLFDKTGVCDLANVANANDLSNEPTTTKDADVATGDVVTGDVAKVAPGTWGKVEFEVANSSDVTANYAVNVTALQTTLPLQFSTNGTDWKSASEITKAIATAPYQLGSKELAVGSAAEKVALYWKWDFNAADNNDTELGLAGTATCNITAGVTFEQVD